MAKRRSLGVSVLIWMIRTVDERTAFVTQVC